MCFETISITSKGCLKSSQSNQVLSILGAVMKFLLRDNEPANLRSGGLRLSISKKCRKVEAIKDLVNENRIDGVSRSVLGNLGNTNAFLKTKRIQNIIKIGLPPEYGMKLPTGMTIGRMTPSI